MHTPKELKAAPMADDEGSFSIWCDECDWAPAAAFSGHGHDPEAFAAELVRRWNAFPLMLEALRGVMEWEASEASGLPIERQTPDTALAYMLAMGRVVDAVTAAS